MNNEGMISAILAVHDMGTYVGEAIDSALAQTRPCCEVLVVDDASQDDTRSVIDRYRRQVEVMYNDRNLSRPVSVNRALVRAKGDYIALLDADDVWMPRHVELLADMLDRHPEAGMSFCRVDMFGAQSGIWPGGVPECEDGRDLLLDLLRHNFVIPSACMIRRDIFLSLGGMDPIRVFYKKKLMLVDDYDLFLKIAMKSKIAGTHEALTRYRIHSGQNSRNRVPLLNAAMLQALRLLGKHGKEERLAAIFDQAVDRVCMQWEENLNIVWMQRNWRGLGQMLAFGLVRKYLGWATLRYLFGARLRPALSKWLS